MLQFLMEIFMNENNSEIDVLTHLMEIEKKASGLVSDAQVEADKRHVETQLKYNTEYKSKYEKLTNTLENNYQQSLEKIKAKYMKEVEEYKQSLNEKNKDEKAFTSLVESLILQ